MFVCPISAIKLNKLAVVSKVYRWYKIRVVLALQASFLGRFFCKNLERISEAYESSFANNRFKNTIMRAFELSRPAWQSNSYYL